MIVYFFNIYLGQKGTAKMYTGFMSTDYSHKVMIKRFNSNLKICYPYEINTP